MELTTDKSELTTKFAKADAIIDTLHKEIFNRRRKKATAQGVRNTFVESGAKSQSDNRFAAYGRNLLRSLRNQRITYSGTSDAKES